MKLIKKRLEIAFLLTASLVETMNENHLSYKLKELPSNTIGEQMWCIVGARESYLNAMKKNKWDGFSCSLHARHLKDACLESLRMTQKAVLDYLNNQIISEDALEFAFALLEHEIQHHGQLIRYFYAHKIPFPPVFQKRYNL